MLDEILSDLPAIQDNGIKWFVDHKGTRHDVVLRMPILFFIGDTQGQDTLCCHYQSRSNTNRVCRYCNVRLKKCGNPYARWTYYDPKSVKSWLDGDHKDKLKRNSFHDVESALLSLCYGDRDSGGLYSSMPAEIVHTWQHGINKYGYVCFFQQKRQYATWTQKEIREEKKRQELKRKRREERKALQNQKKAKLGATKIKATKARPTSAKTPPQPAASSRAQPPRKSKGLFQPPTQAKKPTHPQTQPTKPPAKKPPPKPTPSREQPSRKAKALFPPHCPPPPTDDTTTSPRTNPSRKAKTRKPPPKAQKATAGRPKIKHVSGAKRVDVALKITEERPSEEVFDPKADKEKQSTVRLFTPKFTECFEKIAAEVGKKLSQQSDKDLPRTSFPQGIVPKRAKDKSKMESTKKNAHEIQGVLLLMIIMIASSWGASKMRGGLGEKRSQNWLGLLEFLVLFEEYIKKEDGFLVDDLELVQKLIPALLRQFKKTVN